ncbi:MAG: CHRD domain-containing protein [Chloroflexota bacterium]|nr:MAG: CHRD domain-containing protein [Chloroflexota bacterium]TMD84922.1 MAG: CHRD domain-containing protein [Chloroflexota bacterium]
MRRLIVVALLVVTASLIPAGVAAERLPNSLHGGDPFSAVLSGHGSGTAMVTLNPGQHEVCWEVTVAGLTAPAFASHIHKGAAGVTGPVVVPFFNTGPSTPSSATSFSGCTENVDRALMEDIQDNPAGYYVNVHTSCGGQPATCGPAFPVSAVRGQLTHP